jgi:dTDP-4-dehydrorhamnose 3,5-epimerase
MTFTQTAIAGVQVVDMPVFHDERGSFSPAWVAESFKARGLEADVAQFSIATNFRRGTIRGLHYQVRPFEEAKTIRVVKGAIFDVAVDVRHDSPTFGQWVGVDLEEGDRRLLYLARGIAHGYQTLSDNTEVSYLVSTPYSPEHQRGLRWDDPALGIRWPLGAPTAINERDRTYPDFPPASR